MPQGNTLTVFSFTDFVIRIGSCGVNSTDTDFICAISHSLYDSVPDGGNPNNSPFCGRKLTATRGEYKQNFSSLTPIVGATNVTVTVVDRCQACAYSDVDFSGSAFTQLAPESDGRVDITWVWNT
jgi:hypothetical protein